uniref:Uncharacterized protein n=1 Tax=viral metagenome TaxID=1070528 RepID=A0A6M3JUX3_9ZZZZ
MECPYLKETLVGDEILEWCELVDKQCLLTGGYECEEYIKEEEDDTNYYKC